MWSIKVNLRLLNAVVAVVVVVALLATSYLVVVNKYQSEAPVVLRLVSVVVGWWGGFHSHFRVQPN